MLNRFIKIITSLKLTTYCLAYAVVLVFIGTMAQVHEGLYQAQTRYFKSFFIWWGPQGSDWQIPILPGGYLLGAVLLVNLIAAQVWRIRITRKKLGVLLIHAGLVLLLVGQLLTDLLAKESSMRLVEGQAKNYSESFRDNEVVLIDPSDPKTDLVYAVPEKLLMHSSEVPLSGTPFTLRVRRYWINADLSMRQTEGAVPSGATRGIGTNVFVIPKRAVTTTDERNLPAAVVEVLADGKSLGTWLVAVVIGQVQEVPYNDKTYLLQMRFRRHYKPYSIQLIDFRHDKYKGTDIPKNFSSRVRLINPQTGEDREVLIYMNNPLRYQGVTYYQASYDPRDDRVSILQVVENPGWLTPYVSCVLVSVGLVVQFMSHLTGFLRKQRKP